MELEAVIIYFTLSKGNQASALALSYKGQNFYADLC